jgi:hypothetical protein
LVDSIQSLMYKELQLVLVRTLRKGNENVDWHAKLGASLVDSFTSTSDYRRKKRVLIHKD